MKKKIILPILLATVVIALSAFTVAMHTAGIKWYANSPWDGGSCGDCHAGGASTPTVAITASPAFGAGNTYMPGTTYTITVTVSGTYPKYGFNLEILNSQSASTAADAGTFGGAVTANCTKFATSGFPTTMSHNSAANGIFSFKWTAPASGSCFLYCTGLGANNNGADTGDKLKSISLTLVQSPVGIERPDQSQVNLSVVPNPATDNIRIAYALEQRGLVNISLYNTAGEFVAQLLNETQDPGSQSFETRLPMGIAHGAYLVKLSVDGKEMMKKLLVN